MPPAVVPATTTGAASKADLGSNTSRWRTLLGFSAKPNSNNNPQPSIKPPMDYMSSGEKSLTAEGPRRYYQDEKQQPDDGEMIVNENRPPPPPPPTRSEPVALKVVKKVIPKRKNMVLPGYYEQFGECKPSIFQKLDSQIHSTTPILLTKGKGKQQKTKKSTSYLQSAINAISSLFFSRTTTDTTVKKDQDDLEDELQGIHKVVIIGVHGWFPTKLVRTVIGEPTGTSIKFCEEMDGAFKEYLKGYDIELRPEDVTLIPLEGEGKVLDRVDILYDNLVENSKWVQALREANVVFVATHSQGTPTSILLVARLIKEGLLRCEPDDPTMQRIGVLAMAGISHGPFPYLKGNLIVRWFEAEAAGELFEFMDSDTEIARRYREGLKLILKSGVRMTCVASLEDQVVPLYSAVMTSVSHPSIVRAIYIDGASYLDDFLTHLISFSLKLRNAGIEDHGVLVHLSEVIAGSLYGEGHSTIYDEREVYLLSIRSLLEPPMSLTPEQARSEPILNPFRAKQRLNPFYLPWGLRGVMEQVKAHGDKTLNEEMDQLRKLYDQWSPVSKGLKEIKFRLEPVRSKL